MKRVCDAINGPTRMCHQHMKANTKKMFLSLSIQFSTEVNQSTTMKNPCHVCNAI